MPMGPIDTAPLFAPLLHELIGLLRSLTPDEWHRPTVAGQWRVRDVAAHLLDNDLRRVAASRDGHLMAADGPVLSPADVARRVHGLNATGVQYAQRLSPREIVDLLEITGGWIVALFASLPPHGRATFPVSWAGESESENWMDVGRDYTERWHHQQQIRDAARRPLLLDPRWLGPLLGMSVRVLPVAYAAHTAPDGATVRVVVDESPASTWTLERRGGRWSIESGAWPAPDAVARLSGDTAWRLFYNALSPAELRTRVAIAGDAALVEPLLGARSIVM